MVFKPKFINDIFRNTQFHQDGVDETILSITILQSPQIDQNIRIFMKLILLKTFYTHFPFNKFFSINECQNLTNNEILRCNLPETYILDSMMSNITFGVSFPNVGRITLGELGLPGMTEFMKI